MKGRRKSVEGREDEGKAPSRGRRASHQFLSRLALGALVAAIVVVAILAWTRDREPRDVVVVSSRIVDAGVGMYRGIPLGAGRDAIAKRLGLRPHGVTPAIRSGHIPLRRAGRELEDPTSSLTAAGRWMPLVIHASPSCFPRGGRTPSSSRKTAPRRSGEWESVTILPSFATATSTPPAGTYTPKGVRIRSAPSGWARDVTSGSGNTRSPASRCRGSRSADLTSMSPATTLRDAT